MAWNSGFPCLSLPSAGITGVNHHIWSRKIAEVQELEVILDNSETPSQKQTNGKIKKRVTLWCILKPATPQVCDFRWNRSLSQASSHPHSPLWKTVWFHSKILSGI
jgi:hypothetical protein